MKTIKIITSTLLILLLPLAACDYLPGGSASSELANSNISSQLISESSIDSISSSSNDDTSSVVPSSSSIEPSSSSAKPSSSALAPSSTSAQPSSSTVEPQTGFNNITEFNAPLEIHTAQQKTYLSYTGDYETIPDSLYPNGLNHISDPNPVNISWDYTVPNGKTLSSYSIISGRNSDLSDGFEVSANKNKTVAFYNGYLGRNYFKLKAKFTDNSIDESPIKTFDIDGTAPRNLAIGGMSNNRDIGGWSLEDDGVVKQGLLFRTSGKNYDLKGANITEDGKKVMLQQLKVKTEVNVSNDDSYTLRISGTTVKNFYMDYDKEGNYSLNHFTRNAESVKNYFKLIADASNFPISYHCRIGTDRTGMLTILTLGLLGVPMNDIYKDYLFSNFGKIGERRGIGQSAGQDNIQVYIAFINSLAGKTFKNKVYNVLLSIGLTREVLDAVIDNLTEGPKATNNEAGQIIARAESLTPSGVSIKTDTSDRNHPDKYFTLSSSTHSVSYTFNANKAFTGQVVAYLGKDDSSTSSKIANALGLQLNGNNITINDISYHDAGMGKCGTRMNYFPVLLAETNFTAGSHTIKIQGKSTSMNIGGIYIFDKTSN